MSLPNATKPLLLGSAAAAAYQVSRSLRFNSADSAYLSRTLSTPTTQGTFTLSLWAKLSSLGTTRNILGVSTNHSFQFTSGNALNLTFAGTSALTTTALFRDPSAWHHIVWTQSGTSHTLYMNNVSVGTATATSNAFNTAVAHQLGAANTANYFNGYLSEIYFIDGQALTPSSFAQTDATTGQWVPKTYAGTYGTNGFKLNFSDNSAATAATLGADSSGNGNNWTPTNLSVTAGVGNDSLTDTPTQYGSDTGAGGEVRGNYCTGTPLDVGTTNMAVSNGNLTFVKSGSNFGSARATFFVNSGKWYYECTNNSTNIMQVGWCNNYDLYQSSGNNTMANTGGVGVTYDSRGYRYRTGGSDAITTFLSNTTNDVVMVAIDFATGKTWFGKNGTWLNSGDPATGSNPGYTITGFDFLAPYFNGESGGGGTLNFGQRAFTYTAPSGFKALCVQNLSAPTIVLPSTAFDAKLYTGTGSSQSITGLGFNPDLVWIKSRSAATDNTLYDSVRGAQARLESNNTDVEVTSDAGLTAFNATGFTVNTLAQVNTSAATYVGWCWDESVSAGFDIVTYTGNGGTQNISHSLGVAPKLMIVKCRATVQRWTVYNGSLGAGYYGYLNETLTFDTGNNQLRWGNNSTSVAPTSSVFTIGNSVDVNQSGSTYVAYLWAEVAGFSKFGSYTGNGAADGPFIDCGFRPRFVLIKHSSGAGNNWRIWDSSRFTSNENKTSIYPSLANAEGVEANGIDILSNGFKVRWSDAAVNGSAATYVFMAFAENPFKYANAK